YLLYRRFKRREKKPALPIPLPRKYSLREGALRALDELEGLKLLERGQFRKYYFRLSEILRVFLQDEINLPAVDATTEEIRPHLKEDPSLSPEEHASVEGRRVEMDLVKFAKLVSC